MDQSSLTYQAFLPHLEDAQRETGLPESAAFLFWFLVNVYRLDETDARDAICDKSNDKGIDAIYVDHAEQEIHSPSGEDQTEGKWHRGRYRA